MTFLLAALALVAAQDVPPQLHRPAADDGLAPASAVLAAKVRALPGSRVTAVHVATDHGWSDRRIRLESEVIRWLQALPSASGNSHI